MERPVFKPIGTPSEELDTPALVVDLGAVESNIATVHRRVQDAGSRVRPRLDAHLCPAIGHMQAGAGGTSGVAVSTVGQAEVFSQHGFDNILITNVAVTPSKIGSHRVAGQADHSHSRDRQLPQYRRPQRGGGQHRRPAGRGCGCPRLRRFYRRVAG